MRHPRIKSVLDWMFNLCLFAGAVCIFLFGNTFLPNVSIVNGHSMLPTFQSGDAVVAVRAAAYHTGDIIVYHPDNLPCASCNIVHRIKKTEQVKGETLYLTQGDNNPTRDPWRPTASEIKGKVLFYVPIRGAARILYFPQLWLMLIGLGGSVLMALRLARLLREKQTVTVIDEVPVLESVTDLPRVTFFDLDAAYTRRLPVQTGATHTTESVDVMYTRRLTNA